MGICIITSKPLFLCFFHPYIYLIQNEFFVSCKPRALKQRPKHPAKVHIWGGISSRDATRIAMFSGIMIAISDMEK